jgi:AcrR family transcriptional regulator
MARRIESRAEELDTARRLGKAARASREAAQRSLLLAAMTGAAAAKGYRACRVEDVLERSGLSRSSFYAHFKDKTECFMAAFEVAVEGLLAAATDAVG